MSLVAKAGIGGTQTRPLAGGGLEGFGSLQSFGTPFGSSNRQTPDELLELARLKGGAIAEAAEDLVHPSKGILSTVGGAFKNSLKTFIDIISTPSHVVAGAIDPNTTITEAIRDNLTPADVIFGDLDPDSTTAQKVGNFFIRTATDILLDPLTYVTFGAGAGIAGARATSRITLGANAAAKLDVPELTAKALSEKGQNVFNFVQNLDAQAKGLAKAKNFQLGSELIDGIPHALEDLAKAEFDELLKITTESKLSPEFARKAMSRMLEKYPQLTSTLLDKGGIKVFGNTVLSGQRIAAVTKMIPGMTVLDNITKPGRQAVNALFDTRVVKDPISNQYVRLPEEFIEIEQNARDLAIALQDDRILNLSNIVRANKLDVNEAKMLFANVEAGKIPADPRLARAYKQLLGFNEEEFRFLRNAGINISRLDNHVPHVLVREKTKQIPFKLPPSSKVGAAQQRKLKGTLEEIKASGFMNFDENIVTAHARRSLDNVQVGTTRQFVKEVAEQFGQPASVAPEGYRKISSAAIRKTTEGKNAVSTTVDEFGNEVSMVDPSQFLKSILSADGEEFVFHPAIASRIEKYIGAVINDDATSDMLRAYDSIQNMWKASVTSIFPAFHGRNAISNVFMHMNDIGLQSLNPATHGMAVDLIGKNIKLNQLMQKAAGAGDDAMKASDEMAELMLKPMFTDASGYEWTFGELHRVLREKGVAFTRRITSNIDITNTTDELIDGLFPSRSIKTALKRELNPLSDKFKPFAVGRGFGTMVEEQARMVDFITNLKKTGDVNLAAQRTKQFLFDYSNLTNFEKHVMRRLVPFYTFTRKNLELQVRSLLTTPGRTAAQVKAITTLGDVISGAELTEEEKEALPDWIKGGISILKSKKGETVEILGSLGTPLEQPFQQFQPNVALSSISPILRVPVELASGYSFFHGKALSDVTNAAAFKDAPPAVKDFIKYTKVTGKYDDGTPFEWHVALRPERMHLILSLPPTSRVFSALKQVQTQDVSAGSKVLQQTIGLRPYAFDLEREAAKREKELSNKLEKLLTDAGVGYSFERFIPSD